MVDGEDAVSVDLSLTIVLLLLLFCFVLFFFFTSVRISKDWVAFRLDFM